MFLKVKSLRLEASRSIVIISKDDADEMDIKPLDRVELTAGRRREIAIVNVAEKFVPRGIIGLFSKVQEDLNAKAGQQISVEPTVPPESLRFIKRRLDGDRLEPDEIRQIISDVAEERLSNIEITAFVLSLYNHQMTMKEVAAMSASMAATGDTLELGKTKIYDKHSIGGVCGDKTSMVLVPVVAAAGLTIPKTSSRAITAPAGTADRMECLCPVDLGLDEIRQVVKQTNGCLVWGGAVDLAPADDIFIRVEYPLSIDPLLLPSVMSKKKAVGARYVAIDIPTGKGVKVKTVSEAEELANKFIELGKKLGMRVSCISSFGEQPIGYGVGPALEAREVLASFSNPHRMPKDLLEKVSRLGGELFEFANRKNPDSIAYEMIKSGKAGKKLREIIAAQGGDPDIKPSDIPLGTKRITIKATKPGRVWWINNAAVTAVARMAGAPKDKGAGVLFHKKIGDTVKRGEPLLEIYSEKTPKLNRAIRMGQKIDLMAVGKKFSMVMAEIPEEHRHRSSFILER
jgi:AMP phosphorylase